MSDRYVYVYRLDVEKPAGSEMPGWQPSDWEDICLEKGWVDHYYSRPDLPHFGWPRRRLYLDSHAASERAMYLRRLGAKVRVEVSRRVEWGLDG